jgi:hypothetical protein
MPLNSNTVSGHNGNTPVLTSKPRTFARKTLDGGNIGINGLAAGAKLLSATNELLGLNWAVGNTLKTGGELITRGALIGQAGLGLFDATVEKKNAPAMVGQGLEIGLVLSAADGEKWLYRGISQALLNISSPIVKAYEIFKKAIGESPNNSYYGDYDNLSKETSVGKALQESIVIPFKAYGKNMVELIKNPVLIKKNMTYALSLTSTLMGAGGALGLTAYKGVASFVRFLGAVPTDIVYALMGHHVETSYNPKDKLDIKKMFDFSSYLGWAGKLWLVPGLLDPLKRLPSFESIIEPLTDIADAFDRCASAFYQASLFSTKAATEEVTTPSETATNETKPQAQQPAQAASRQNPTQVRELQTAYGR